MFVDAKRKFVCGPKVMQEGHEYSIDSGMGGSYTVRYLKFEDNNFVFKRVYHKGAEPGPQHIYKVPYNELSKTIFVVVPRENYFEAMDTAYRIERGIHPEHELRCPGCRKTGWAHIEFIGPQGDTATVVFEATDPTTPISIYTTCNSAPPNTERRAALYETCMICNDHAGRSLGWTQTEDQRRWVCPSHEVGNAYKALIEKGFKPHGEEADWLKTGKWPE